MKKIGHKIIFILLFVALFITSVIVMSIYGKTYIVKLNMPEDIKTIDDISMIIENKNNNESKDVVKCINKELENGFLTLTFESVSMGKAYVDINYKGHEEYDFFLLYVHQFGIITYNDFFGNSMGSKIIPISIAILLAYLFIVLIMYYKRQLKENMHKYKNIACLGLIIFMGFAVLNQFFTIFNYSGLIETINAALRSFSVFSIILLPIAFIISIFVIISNVVLISKEGASFRNILGLLLSIFFLGATLFPEYLNNALQASEWIDVHNSQSIVTYLMESIGGIIYVCVAYLECILIATICLTIKSAKHIPKFNKDAIIILGCQIKKDGSLTNLLKARVDRAIEFAKLQEEKSGKNIIFVPSGGKGDDEIISEAQAMKNYLLEQGINEVNILIEDKSTNTYENIKFSNELIQNKIPNANIAFSTTNYHVLRAGSIAYNQGINAEGIGAKTRTYFWINAFVREFIASLNSEKKIHIPAMLLLIIIPVFMNLLVFLSNIL